MYWLESGLATQVIHKQGGWTPSSAVPSKHYTSVSAHVIEMMKAASQRRSSHKWEQQVGKTSVCQWLQGQ